MRLACRYRNLLTCLLISALTSSALTHGKDAKANQGHLVALFQRICHAAEHSVDCFLRIGFGQVGIGCYRIYEFGLVHKDESPAEWIVCEYTNGQNRPKATLRCKPTTRKPWYAVADNRDGAVSATLYQGPSWRVNKGPAVTADMHELSPFASACFQCARTPPV